MKGYGEFVSALDVLSRRILWHFRAHGHATLQEVAWATGLHETTVLLRIKRVINEAAQLHLGFPVLGFWTTRVDPESGERVEASWWLNPLWPIAPAVDLFDEVDSIVLVAQVGCEVDLALPPEVSGMAGFLTIRIRKRAYVGTIDCE